MQEIEPIELLATLRKVAARGAVETADRELILCRQVWQYAVATGRVLQDITSSLKGALTPYRGKHFAAITDPEEFGVLPGVPTWWVPEHPVSFAFVIALGVLGFILSLKGKHLDRFLNA
jgi:hypothetical protein